jgi:hypothetical protein
MANVAYTQAQIDAISNFSIVAYYNNINLGVLQPGALSVKIVKKVDPFGSSASGDNGAIGMINDGSHAVATLSFRNINKHVLKALSGYDLTAGSTATNISTPWVGAVTGVSNPSIETGSPLVLRPIATNRNTNTALLDDVSNILTLLFPKAVLSSDIEIPFSTSEVTDYDLEFTCLNDATQNPSTFMYWDDGITSSGTYTS